MQKSSQLNEGYKITNVNSFTNPPKKKKHKENDIRAYSAQ